MTQIHGRRTAQKLLTIAKSPPRGEMTSSTSGRRLGPADAFREWLDTKSIRPIALAGYLKDLDGVGPENLVHVVVQRLTEVTSHHSTR